MSKTKTELEAENKELRAQVERADLLERQVARQQLQLQLLEQYANTVLAAGNQLMSNIEALNTASGEPNEQN